MKKDINNNTHSTTTNGEISKTGKSYASTLVDMFNVPVTYNNENGNEVILLSNKLEHLHEKYPKLKEILIDEVVNQYNKAEQEAVQERGMPEKMRIVKFNKDKGFGFLKPKHGKNIFFHVSDDEEFEPTKKRRFNPIELKEGDEIFVYGTSKEERGTKVTKWSTNNLIDKKISEFKNGFEIDTKPLENIASKYFFDNLTDEEILALGPVYINVGIPINIRGLELKIKCTVVNIELRYNNTGVNLIVKNNDQERMIPIETKQNVVKSDYNSMIFSIDSLNDFIELNKSIPKPLEGYIIGDSKKEYPPKGKKMGEYINLTANRFYGNWDVQKDDWSVAVLEDKNTEIVGVDNDTGKILVKNDVLIDLSLCNKEHIYELNTCYVVNSNRWSGYEGMPYLEYRKQTQKDLKIIEITLPYYRKYLEEKYTNDLIGDLEKHPEKYLITSQPHVFANTGSGEYFSITNHLDPDVFFEVKKEKDYVKYSLIDYNRVKTAITNILEKTDNLKESIIDKNYDFVKKVVDAYDDITKAKKHLQDGGGGVKKYEYKIHNPSRHDDIISGLYDQQEERIIAKSHTYETTKRTGGYTQTLGGNDGWRRGMEIHIPAKRENVIETKYYSCLGDIDSIETLAQEIEKKGSSHPVFEKLLQDKQLEDKILEEAGQGDKALQYRFKKELSILCDNKDILNDISYELRTKVKVTDELKKIKEASYDINTNTYTVILDEIKRKVNYLINIAPKTYNTLFEKIKQIKDDLNEQTKEFNINLIINEINKINDEIDKALSLTNELMFDKAETLLNDIEIKIEKLHDIHDKKSQQIDNEIQEKGIPSSLIEAYDRDIEKALQFMSNVSKLPTNKLDFHEITCGRSRCRGHLDDVWNSIGGSGDFFCGADPNDVKYYVYDHHTETPNNLGGSVHEEHNPTSSNDTMQEALRKAGLI